MTTLREVPPTRAARRRPVPDYGCGSAVMTSDELAVIIAGMRGLAPAAPLEDRSGGAGSKPCRSWEPTSPLSRLGLAQHKHLTIPPGVLDDVVIVSVVARVTESTTGDEQREGLQL